MRLHTETAQRMWCSACGQEPLLLLRLFCGSRKVSCLPTHWGGPAAVAAPLGPLGRPCRKSPGLFVLPLSHSLDRDGSGLSIHARASPALMDAADEWTSWPVVLRLDLLAGGGLGSAPSPNECQKKKRASKPCTRSTRGPGRQMTSTTKS